MKKILNRNTQLGNSLLIVALVAGAVVILAVVALALWSQLSSSSTPTPVTTSRLSTSLTDEVAPAKTVSDLDKYDRDLDGTDLEALERL